MCKTVRKFLICSFKRIIILSIATNSLCRKPVRLKFWYFASSSQQNCKSFLACTVSVMVTTNKKRKAPSTSRMRQGFMCRNTLSHLRLQSQWCKIMWNIIWFELNTLTIICAHLMSTNLYEKYYNSDIFYFICYCQPDDLDHRWISSGYAIFRNWSSFDHCLCFNFSRNQNNDW